MKIIPLPRAISEAFGDNEEAEKAFIEVLNHYGMALEYGKDPLKDMKIPPALREFWGDPACDALLDLYRQHYANIKAERERERNEDNS